MVVNGQAPAIELSNGVLMPALGLGTWPMDDTQAEATIPEIRLAVAEPELDVGNVETALEALSTTCYYLSAEKNRYRFSLSPNQDLHVVEWRGNEIGR